MDGVTHCLRHVHGESNGCVRPFISLLWKRTYAWIDVLLPANLWALSEWLRTIGPVCMPASYAGNIADVLILKPWLRRRRSVDSG